jgi:hypothetical protein
MSRNVPRSLRWIAGLGWLLFGAGILSFIFVYLRYGGSSGPRARWRSRWGTPRWVTFRDPLGQFLIDHPSDWDESAPFERFTRHRVGDLVAADTLALRHAHPTGLLVVIRYVAPRALTNAEWLNRTRPGGPLGDVFGEHILARGPAHLAGRSALHVTAEGMVTDRLYHLESWFLPNGGTAFRVTTGSPPADLAAAGPILGRIVSSFRLTPAVSH